MTTEVVEVGTFNNFPYSFIWRFIICLSSKEYVCNSGNNTAGALGWIPGWEDALEEKLATQASIFAWEIPCTEKPGWATVHGVTKGLDTT